MRRLVVFVLISFLVYFINKNFFLYIITQDMPEPLTALGLIMLIMIDILYLRYLIGYFMGKIN